MGTEKNKSHEKRERKVKDVDGVIDYREMRFVNLGWTKENDEAFDVWVAENDVSEAVSYWIGLTEDTAKVTLSYSVKSESYVASVSYARRGHFNSGLTLTGHAELALEAVLLVVFKDQEMCANGSWLEGENRHGRRHNKRQ